jgi:class 3 adenylate cyclase
VNREPVAVAFVDVVDFTARTDRFGDDVAIAIVDALELAVRASLTVDGMLVKLLGDGALCTFTHPTTAVRAMTDVVTRLEQHAITARAALHFGPVIHRNDDVFGQTVNVAARLVRAAAPGEVLCSDAISAAVTGTALRFTTRRFLDLRGISDRVAVASARDAGVECDVASA